MRSIINGTILLLAASSLLARPTTLQKSEKHELRYIESRRTEGFGDREIDRLHTSIASILAKTKVFLDKGFYEKSKLYMDSEPVEGHMVYLADTENMMYYDKSIFFKDGEGKPYVVIDLGQGLSWNDYPTSFTYESKAFVYPSDDFKSLAKVIMQFKRTNADKVPHIREMRRLVNETAVSASPVQFEGEEDKNLPKVQEENVVDTKAKKDNNADIRLEYYTSNDGVNFWPDKPDIQQKPGMVAKLHDLEDVLSYDNQKNMFDNYKTSLQKIEKTLKKRLYIMELNKRGTNRKMLINY
ncbi:MAG: hypothetical protein H7A25_24810 [Leptospiraceae bacterium]|nr:hypothetical protein [Leptospiraceae bacterium]MCP5503144.1 hypothetical protein [Leptospiraceae bacterium]